MIRIQPVETGWWAAAHPGIQATDFRAAVSVRISDYDPDIESDLPYYGLIFGLDENWSKFYSFEILPDGWWGLWLYEKNNDDYSFKELAVSDNPSPYIFLGTQTNRLMVERSGLMIRLYANNHLLIELPEPTIIGAHYIGVIGENYFMSTPLSVYFDDFSIYPVDCPLSTVNQSPDSTIGAFQPRSPQIIYQLGASGRAPAR